MHVSHTPTIQLSVPPPPQRGHSEHSFGRTTPAAGFPVAPAEWRRQTEPAPVDDTSHEAVTRHVLIACSLVLAVIVLVAIAFSGGGHKPSAAAGETPPPGPGHKVEMTVVPAKP